MMPGARLEQDRYWGGPLATGHQVYRGSRGNGGGWEHHVTSGSPTPSTGQPAGGGANPAPHGSAHGPQANWRQIQGVPKAVSVPLHQADSSIGVTIFYGLPIPLVSFSGNPCEYV
jgi:hypothetical protein